MGKGGEKSAAKAAVSSDNLAAAKQPTTEKIVKNYKLSKMPNEELKKWARAYGYDAELDREVLLAALVCVSILLISDLILFLLRILLLMEFWILIDLLIFHWSLPSSP